MYGGSDGGAQATGLDSYQHGHEFSDLWALDYPTGVWRLQFNSPGLPHGPPPSLNGGMAAFGPWLLFWGGSPSSTDVWGWHTQRRVLKRIALVKEGDAQVPGACNLAAASVRALTAGVECLERWQSTEGDMAAALTPSLTWGSTGVHLCARAR